jgi:thioredoxin 1
MITDENFKTDVLDAKGLILVDFFANWCGPCRQLSPILEGVAAEMGDKIKVVKVDVDQAETTASAYGIQSIPTLIIFKNGEIVDKKSGSMSPSELKSWINSKI